MTFHPIQTELARSARAASAHPAPDCCVWDILRNIREARAILNIKDRAITVLQAMISVLPKGNSGARVFASNRTLCDRANGMEERTLRRHIQALIGAGLIIRQNSPNGKRFSRRDPDNGTLIGYGFDLTPLLERAPEIAMMAEEARNEKARISILRNRLSQLRYDLLSRGDREGQAEDLRKVLRRKMGSNDLRAFIDSIEATMHPEPSGAETNVLSANDSRNDRHIHRSNTKDLDSESAPKIDDSATTVMSEEHGECGIVQDEATSVVNVACKQKGEKPDMTLQDVRNACPEIFCFAPSPVRHWEDFNRLGRSVGRMSGVTEELIDRAERILGASGLAMTIAAMIQMGARIKSPGAYLRSLVQRSSEQEFDPVELMARMVRFAA